MELQYVSQFNTCSQWSLSIILCLTASGESDFEAHSADLTFGPGNTEQDVDIRITNDLQLETDEQFSSTVFLTMTDIATTLNPGTAGITIIDDDGKWTNIYNKLC